MSHTISETDELQNDKKNCNYIMNKTLSSMLQLSMSTRWLVLRLHRQNGGSTAVHLKIHKKINTNLITKLLICCTTQHLRSTCDLNWHNIKLFTGMELQHTQLSTNASDVSNDNLQSYESLLCLKLNTVAKSKSVYITNVLTDFLFLFILFNTLQQETAKQLIHCYGCKLAC